ncbi:MAG TPA: hypothetical protein DEH78_25640, partial [Solibacterales bacterium]|nr:hypothetical protein [Bryobacterales bacterium]
MTRGRAVAAIFALAALAAAQRPSAPARATKEGFMEQMSGSKAFDVRNPTEESMDGVADMIRERGKLGIYLLGPRSLALDEDFKLPIAIFDFFSAQARAGLFLAEHGALVVTRVESRETFAAPIGVWKEPVDPAERRPPPPAKPSTAKVMKQFTLDARDPAERRPPPPAKP